MGLKKKGLGIGGCQVVGLKNGFLRQLTFIFVILIL